MSNVAVMSNTATIGAISMTRDQLLEEAGKMLPILKGINDREDTIWQQEQVVEYREQKLKGGWLRWCLTIDAGVAVFLILSDLPIVIALAGGVAAAVLAKKGFNMLSYSMHGGELESAKQQIARLSGEVSSMRAQHMGWMSKIFPEEMLFYDAVSYIHNALRMGMADNFKEAVNNYMTHLHQSRMEASQQEIKDATERAATAAAQTADEVRQLRMYEMWKDFLS